MIVFYGYDKCSTCRKAKQQLTQWGRQFEAIDITQSPPPKRLLESLLAGGDYSLNDLWNRSGQEYRALGMKDKLKTLSESQALALLASNGRLVKRPIVSDGRRYTVGFDPQRFAEVWG